MFKRFVAVTVSAVLALSAGAAGAAELCQAPGPPPDQSLRPIAPVKPATPACVNPVTRMATGCRQTVIKTYNADIEAFNLGMNKFNADGNAYIDALNHWARAGVEYANCEIQALNRSAMQ